MRETFCQICRAPLPGHDPGCPVWTGAPVPGAAYPFSQQLAAALQAHLLAGQLGQLGQPGLPTGEPL